MKKRALHGFPGAMLIAFGLAACTDVPTPAEPGEIPHSVTNTSAPRQGPDRTLDREFARLAGEVPGFGGLFLVDGAPVAYLTDLGQREAAEAALTPFLAAAGVRGRR